MKSAYGISDDSSAKGAVRSALDSCLLQLAGGRPVAGLIFWGADYDSAEIAAACAATLGDVPHIGCTTNGEITSQGLGMNSVCLFLFSSDRMSARTSQISLSVGSEEAGRAVAASLRGVDRLQHAAGSVGLGAFGPAASYESRHRECR